MTADQKKEKHPRDAMAATNPAAPSGGSAPPPTPSPQLTACHQRVEALEREIKTLKEDVNTLKQHVPRKWKVRCPNLSPIEHNTRPDS